MILNRSEQDAKALCYCYRAGCGLILFRMKGGRLHCFVSAKENMCFVGSCLMDSIVFDVMIEAVEDTEVIIIPTSVLSQIMKENPGLKCICIKLPWNAFRMSCGQCSKFFL